MASSPAPPINASLLSQLKPAIFSALPWLAVFSALVGINHAAGTQTLVTGVAQNSETAIDYARHLWLIAPATCAAGLLTALFTTPTKRLAAAAASVLIFTLLAAMGPAFLYPVILVPVVLIAQHLKVFVKDATSWRSDLFAGSILSFILAHAANLRQEKLFKYINAKPDPDFETYFGMAQSASGYSTAFREPLYIWLLQIIDVLGGELSHVMLRLTGVAGGLAAVAAIFYICRKHLNLLVAAIAASIYASQNYLILTSIRGLREDWIVCLTFLFISAGWTHLNNQPNWKSLTYWGLVSAAGTLLRISNFSFAIMTIAATGLYRFVRDIKSWKQRALWSIPIIMTIVLIAPWLAHNKQLYGDPFFVVNRAARFFANEEFGGTPGFPTKAEIARDAYVGPKLTPREYIFNYHSKPEVVQRTWDGFVKTFFGDIFKIGFGHHISPQFTNLYYALHFIGLALLLFPRRIYLVLAMFFFHSSTFFLASIPTFDPRLLVVAMAFGHITVASAIGLSLEYAYRYLQPDAAGSDRSSGSSKPSESRSKSRPQKKRKQKPTNAQIKQTQKSA